jgi:hypothetical protein
MDESWDASPMERPEETDAHDVLLHERAIRASDRHGQERAVLAIDESLVLFVVSLYNVNNLNGDLLTGDALLVRRRGTPMTRLLASILGCQPDQLGELAGSTGSWSIQEVAEIDGHRVRFESG